MKTSKSRLCSTIAVFTGILTTSTGYLSPLTRSQLAGSIAARFETLANIGISIKPLNERESGFDSVDAKEVSRRISLFALQSRSK